MSRIKNSVLIMILLLPVSVVPADKSSSVKNGSLDFSVFLSDNTEMDGLKPWQKELLNTYMATIDTYAGAESVSFRKIKLSLLPGMEVYIAGGYTGGGHKFLNSKILMLENDRAVVLDARTSSLDSSGEETAFRGVDICSGDYYTGMLKLDSSDGEKWSKRYNALYKKTCTDITPRIIKTIQDAYKNKKVTKEFVFAAAYSMGIIVNNAGSAKLLDGAGEIVDKRLKQMVSSGKKKTSSAAWYNETMAIPKLLADLNDSGFSIAGVMEISDISSGKSRLVRFGCSWDGREIRYVQKVMAGTITYIE